jgi:hypothetical protein
MQTYATETGRRPYLFSGSSPGAAEFGIRDVRWESGAWRVSAPTPGAGAKGAA